MDLYKDFLSAKEFAACLNIHYNTVRKMIKTGRINAFKMGIGGKTSDLRIPRTEIQKLCLEDMQEDIEKIIKERSLRQEEKCKISFFEKVEKSNTCWLWQGSLSESGYGSFRYKGIWMRAHRASYLMFVGNIPKDILVLHSCDIRNCVRPDHLHLGTPQDNMNERSERNRFIPKKGEDHPCSKISNDDVKEIVKLREKKIPAKQIAREFNISPEYVYQLSSGKYRSEKT
jgi:excisionase family DNA binding protein